MNSQQKFDFHYFINPPTINISKYHSDPFSKQCMTEPTSHLFIVDGSPPATPLHSCMV